MVNEEIVTSKSLAALVAGYTGVLKVRRQGVILLMEYVMNSYIHSFCKTILL